MIHQSQYPPAKTSWKEIAAKLPESEREKLLQGFGDNYIAGMMDDWLFHARREQLEPPGNWFIWIIMAGRGWGKTLTGAHWLIERHRWGLAQNSGIVAATTNDLRRFCLQGPSGILQQAPQAFYPKYNKNDQRLVWPNGTTTDLFTAEEPNRLRGPNLDTAWCDELSWWKDAEDVWDMLMFTLRISRLPKVCITMTPRPLQLVKDLVKRDDIHLTRGSTYENLHNLAEQFQKSVVSRYANTRLGRQELGGEILDDVEGALWSRTQLEGCRVDLAPKTYKRIVIGVDPSTTSGEKADETGIVVCGMSKADLGYVIADHSMKGHPDDWGRKIAWAFEEYDADCVVAEKNQGGEMVRSIIHNAQREFKMPIPVRLVHAAKGKVTRAEPVAMLYEQGKIFHTGFFPKLEDEMCSFVPGEEFDRSPNRADALVYALSNLFIKLKGGRARGLGRAARSQAARPRARIGMFG